MVKRESYLRIRNVLTLSACIEEPGENRIVPFPMKVLPNKREGVHFLIGNLDPLRVESLVERTLDREPLDRGR